MEWHSGTKIFLLPMLRLKTPSDEKVFIESLIQFIDEMDKGKTSYALPDMHEQYRLAGDTSQINSASALTSEIQKLSQQLSDANENIAKIQNLKAAVFANDQPLVEAVANILRDMGMTVTDGPEGRDDLVTRFGGRDVVIEVKGRGVQGRGRKRCRTTGKWVSRVFDETGTAPKGILVVNGYREFPLQERTEAVFPHQMLDYSQKRDHCLISGLQLLCLDQAVRRGDISANDAAQSLIDTVGVYSKYKANEWEELFSFKK